MAPETPTLRGDEGVGCDSTPEASPSTKTLDHSLLDVPTKVFSSPHSETPISSPQKTPVLSPQCHAATPNGKEIIPLQPTEISGSSSEKTAVPPQLLGSSNVIAGTDVAASPKALKEPAKKDEVDDVTKCPKCAVPCCKRTGEKLYQTTFFPCPLEPHPSSRLWAKAIGVKVIQKNMYICEDHFQLEDDLENYLKFKYYPRGQQRFPRFKKGVVPWRFPKCQGMSPSAHHHRVPFSKTEYYRRQRARINQARRGVLAKEMEDVHNQVVSATKSTCSQQPKQSKVDQVKMKPKGVKNARVDSGRGNRQRTAKRGKKFDETEGDSTEKVYFNMLNGDLSSLISHVQPTICGWDVSEVRPENPGRGVSPNSKNESEELDEQDGEGSEEQNSGEETEDDIYFTPSEDESNDQDTSDTDFTISSEESWRDHEIVSPARRSARNHSQRSKPSRYSPPTVLRSRSKKKSFQKSNESSPESAKTLEKPPETRSSDSGVSSGDAELRENGVEIDNTLNQPGGNEKISVSSTQNQSLIKSFLEGTVPIKPPLKGKSQDTILIKPPLRKNTPHRKSNGLFAYFLEKNAKRTGVSSDSEDVVGTSTVSSEVDGSASKGSQNPGVLKIATTSTLKNIDSRCGLRTTRVTGGRFEVDMSQPVGKVTIPESQTTYSYMSLLEAKRQGCWETASRKRLKSDSYLVVRDGDQALASTRQLSPQICGLIANMRKTFLSFFDNLHELKMEMSGHHANQNGKKGDTCLAEPIVDRLLDEVTKFPDLLELEMSQFVTKCEKDHESEMEKSLKNSKKIRWCSTCQEAARFHCCFSAAYCSRLCQSNDWERHNHNCGQSRMLLDDPDLILNPVMLSRLKEYQFFKPTIGASMTNLEQLSGTTFRKFGQRILAANKSLRNVTKRGNTSAQADSSRPKATEALLAVRGLPTALAVANAPRMVATSSQNVAEAESENAEIPEVKTEPLDVDMEVEEGAPPPRPNLITGCSLGSKTSPPTNQQVRIAIPHVPEGLPNVRPVTNKVPRLTQLNSSPRLTLLPKCGAKLVLPSKASTVSTVPRPVTLRCKTVVLPSGETQYIPLDGQKWSFRPNAQLVVKHVNHTSGTPVTVVKQAMTSGSILITRPSKPTYSKFIAVAPAPTQILTSPIVSPEVTSTEHLDVPQLPKLTPVMPKSEPAAFRVVESVRLPPGVTQYLPSSSSSASVFY